MIDSGWKESGGRKSYTAWFTPSVEGEEWSIMLCVHEQKEGFYWYTLYHLTEKTTATKGDLPRFQVEWEVTGHAVSLAVAQEMSVKAAQRFMDRLPRTVEDARRRLGF